MNIHEYQAKELLAKFGVPVPDGYAAMRVDEAVAAATKLPGPLYVVKAQIHAGGRGKGRFKELGPDAKGGVRLARSLDEVREAAAEMLGNTLVTIQTGEQGKQVNRLYVTDGVDIAKEFYLALLVDRKTGRVAFVASTEGGMDIEAVAHDTPEKIMSFTVDPATGFMPHHGRAVAHALGLSGDLAKQAQKVAKLLHDAFLGTDASQIEINPLAVTDEGEGNPPRLLVLDAKVGFDLNAMFRHPELEKLRDESEEDPMELEASRYDLAYIKLDGNIGCMVNGAGLAMATMDIIKLEGGEPANFCDVGGGASKEKVAAAFKIILSDPAVEGILVNIFGGIMRCDIIAEGIVAAAREIDIKVPLVVRLEGTNVEEGKRILADSGLAIVPADDLGDAARKIVAEVTGKGAGVKLPRIVAASLAFAAQPSFAQEPNAGVACVLHVTGTVPPPPMRPNAFIRVQGPVEDPNDPSTRAYQYNPITRALGLSDTELRTLLPSATELAIVRHPEGLARDRDKRAQAPLYPRTGQCHAELIVSDVVGVFGEEARPLGLLQALLVGGNRLEAIFTFRRFDGGEGRPVIVSSREDGRLPAPVSSGSGAAAITAAMAAATSEAFSDFAGNVARRSRQ